jgi:DNA-binding winged helix-turn-helix (wHTH) protein
MEEHLTRQFNLLNLGPTFTSFNKWISYFQKHHTRFVLILPDAEKYLTFENKHILSILFDVVIDYAPLVTAFSFYEVDITHPHYLSLLSVIKDLFENIFTYPLYNHIDTLEFVRYLQQKWETKISHKEEQKIIAACGGHFWVVKEAVRELINTGKWSYEEEGMRFRLEAIYSSLQSSEQALIEKIATKKRNFTSEENHSLIHMRKLNFFNAQNRFQIGMFDAFHQHRLSGTHRLTLEDSTVTLNSIPLDRLLSRKEYRIVKVLLENKGETVSRDTIASRIWPTKTQEKYSDWAIDQLMTRIRKRLVELSLPPKLISVVRGKGYRFDSVNIQASNNT